MPICKQIEGWPCHHYDSTKPDELNAFLIEHGGNAARFDGHKTAHVLTQVKGEDRFTFVNPGSYIRAIGPGQFSACTEKRFLSLYYIEPETAVEADAN